MSMYKKIFSLAMVSMCGTNPVMAMDSATGGTSWKDSLLSYKTAAAVVGVASVAYLGHKYACRGRFRKSTPTEKAGSSSAEKTAESGHGVEQF